MLVDLISLIIITITVIFSFFRGFTKEVFGLVGIILSIVLTYYNYDFFSGMIGIKSQLVANLISTFLIFIIVIVAVTIVNSGIIYVLRPIRLGPTDRILGVTIGVIKGIFFSFLFFMFLKLVYYTLALDPESKDITAILPNWMMKSKVYKPFRYIEHNLDQALPESVYENMKYCGQELNNIFSIKEDEEDLDKSKKTIKKSPK